MKVELQLKFMAFTMNQLENMVMLMFGNISQKFLIIFHLRLSLKERYFHCMVVFLLVSIHLIKLDNWKEFRKFHKRDQCATYCGLILMLILDGEFPLEELVICLAKIFLINSSILII